MLNLLNTTKHQGLRNLLAAKLQEKGISQPAVLKAIKTVPRHLFLDSSFEDHAYMNKAFPIGADQTISHPYTVAFQTELLEVLPTHKILEIGTGSGYQTAVLLELKAQVFTVERQLELFKKTQIFFRKAGYRPKKHTFGDGYLGMPEDAPFDSIVVTAGAPYVPKPLLEQLKIGGRLVIPIGDKEQEMTLYIRTAANSFERKTFGSFKFVPLLEKKN
mgnify:FL=1|jgi:protein-L-isoaspartate(D-aspartate) O-methyltransferase